MKYAMVLAAGLLMGACGNSLESWAEFEKRCPEDKRVGGMGLALSGAAATVCEGDATAGVTPTGNSYPGMTGSTAR